MGSVEAGAELVLPYYGMISAIAIDPIEKKPLYHFLPGSKTFSVGYVGCNMHCPFCQNYHISRNLGVPLEYVSAEELVAKAKASGCPSIAHTYSEALIHLEYLEECMSLAKENNIANLLVTNGFIEKDASAILLSLCDAVNVDIKAWDKAFYERELGGKLEAVLAFVEAAVSAKVHVEATTLVIPGKNDDPEQTESISRFLAGLSADIPLHLSAYRPMYKYDLPATPASTIIKLKSIAGKNLKYVYEGNIYESSADTKCPKCGTVLVKRYGYNVKTIGLKEDTCSNCGAKSPIITKFD
ncbi:AmmeMemoRadiSam system radical SAM enzyme [Spirochaetota bacterium]